MTSSTRFIIPGTAQRDTRNTHVHVKRRFPDPTCIGDTTNQPEARTVKSTSHPSATHAIPGGGQSRVRPKTTYTGPILSLCTQICRGVRASVVLLGTWVGGLGLPSTSAPPSTIPAAGATPHPSSSTRGGRPRLAHAAAIARTLAMHHSPSTCTAQRGRGAAPIRTRIPTWILNRSAAVQNSSDESWYENSTAHNGGRGVAAVGCQPAALRRRQTAGQAARVR